MSFCPSYYYFFLIFENFGSRCNISQLLHSSPKGIWWFGGSIQLDFIVHFLTSNSMAKLLVVQGVDKDMNCVGMFVWAKKDEKFISNFGSKFCKFSNANIKVNGSWFCSLLVPFFYFLLHQRFVVTINC